METAIAEYKEPMRTRAAKEAQDSLEMTEWMHAEGALAKMAPLLNHIQ